MRQAPNLGRMLCKSSLSPSNSSSGIKYCGKSFVFCQYISEGIKHTFKMVDKIKIRVSFNCELKNLTYVVICIGCQEDCIGQTYTMLKERLNTYRQHIRQPELQTDRYWGSYKNMQWWTFQIYFVFCNSGRHQNL